jgi:FkbM family methyltransferase
MPRELGGFLFECSLRDNIAREVFFAGCYEPQESAFVRSVLKPGMSFVDMGSNWGFFALMAAYLTGPAGRVVALEPDPRVFRKLKSNVERNRLQQVHVLQVAAADRDAHLVLAGHDEHNENPGMSRLVESGGASELNFAVPARQLDSLLDEIGLHTIDLLKIDVEGAEHMALAGMEAGLKRFRYRRILLELHPLHPGETRPTLPEVCALLAAKGYKGCALDYSLATSRRACYRPGTHFTEFLRPLEQAFEDSWPHTLWLAPDYASMI